MFNNKYLLSTMIAKRANQLENGAKPLVDTKYRKPVLIALEEIEAGKVFIKEKEEPLKAEDVFHGEESVKMEESVRTESIPDETKEFVKIEEISDEAIEPEKPVEIEEIFDEDEKPEKSEGLL